MTRLLLFLGFMLLSAGVLYLLLQEDARRRGAAPSDLAAEPLNEMRLRDVALREQEGGRIRLRIWAESATFYENRGLLRLEGVRFTLLPAAPPGKEGPPVEGSARSGELVRATGRITLTGDVRVTRGTALELRTERLEYTRDDALLLAPERVWIRQGTSVQQGREMRYSIPDESLTLKEPLLAQ